MERQRKKIKRSRPKVGFDTSRDQGQMEQHTDGENVQDFALPGVGNTINIPYHAAASSHIQLNTQRTESDQTAHSQFDQTPTAAPQLSSTSFGFGNTRGLGTQYNHDNVNLFGDLTPSQSHGQDSWTHQTQARPVTSFPNPAAQYNTSGPFLFQGANNSPSPILFPVAASQVYNSMLPPTQYVTLSPLPADGELVQILALESQRYIAAKLRLGSDFSFIQQWAVTYLGLSPYFIPRQKKRFLTTPTGAQTPRAFAKLLLDMVGYSCKGLKIEIQITVNDPTEPPVILGKGAMHKATEKLVSTGYQPGSTQYLPVTQGLPNQMQYVAPSASMWTNNFTPFAPLGTLMVGPSNLVIPPTSTSGMVHPESHVTSFDSTLSPSYPSRQSGDVETISSVTSPMDDLSFKWNESDFHHHTADSSGQALVDVPDVVETDTTPRPHFSSGPHHN